ncbi:MAG: FAD-binding oxidoreductase [Bacteroidetes bacterium]|nr:FAD-binding oxidoreductase [Bacteroidota bacterium]
MKSNIPTSKIEALAKSIKGKLIKPGDNNYDEARSLYNAMIDKRPALIVQCADTTDVQAAIQFSKEHQLRLAVRGGGHNGAGFGSVDDGLVIDLSPMKAIHVDTKNQTVLVQSGCTLAEIDKATHPFGLAIPTGVFSTTGIGGLALGGGLGYLTRQHGFTIDNLLEASVVLADGTTAKASEFENPDLFWAIRGGGGNFGIVTSFLFKAHPVSTIYGGPMLWPLEDAEQILGWFDRFIDTAPTQLSGFFALMTVPPGAPFPEDLQGKRVCAIVWCCNCSEERATAVFDSIRQYRKPALDWTGPMPFPALQGMFDPTLPKGLQWYWKGDFVTRLDNKVIADAVQQIKDAPTWQSLLHLYPVNGRAATIPPDATAWHYRKSKYAVVIAGVSEKPEDKDIITAWTKNYASILQPSSDGGGYVNFMMNEGNNTVERIYAGNLKRLSSIKAKFDPANLFSINQNIQPA